MEDSRTKLVELMVETHKVTAQLAEHWVDQMTDAEVAEELRLRK